MRAIEISIQVATPSPGGIPPHVRLFQIWSPDGRRGSLSTVTPDPAAFPGFVTPFGVQPAHRAGHGVLLWLGNGVGHSLRRQMASHSLSRCPRILPALVICRADGISFSKTVSRHRSPDRWQGGLRGSRRRVQPCRHPARQRGPGPCRSHRRHRICGSRTLRCRAWSGWN